MIYAILILLLCACILILTAVLYKLQKRVTILSDAVIMILDYQMKDQTAKWYGFPVDREDIHKYVTTKNIANTFRVNGVAIATSERILKARDKRLSLLYQHWRKKMEEDAKLFDNSASHDAMCERYDCQTNKEDKQ